MELHFFKLHLKCHFVELWNHTNGGKLEVLLLFYSYISSICTVPCSHGISIPVGGATGRAKPKHAKVWESTSTESRLVSLKKMFCLNVQDDTSLKAWCFKLHHVISFSLKTFEIKCSFPTIKTNSAFTKLNINRDERVSRGNITSVQWFPELLPLWYIK